MTGHIALMCGRHVADLHPVRARFAPSARALRPTTPPCPSRRRDVAMADKVASSNWLPVTKS